MTITEPCWIEPPLQLFRIQLTEQKDKRRKQKPGSSEKEKIEQPLICAHCSAVITTSTQAISINGRHEHAFFNPAGIAFEIRCYRKAPGCKVQGRPTTMFSWFDDHSWQFATCRSCLIQLGWFFLSAERENSFFGLMTNKVI